MIIFIDIIFGVLLRLIIVYLLLAIMTIARKHKKSKKKIDLALDERSRIFVGYLIIVTFPYFVAQDLNYGYDSSLNSAIWAGMFFGEWAAAIVDSASKIKDWSVKKWHRRYAVALETAKKLK